MAKVMISLPDDVLARIDAAVSARSTTRSAFLREAARRELERRGPEEIDAAVARLRESMEGAESFDSTEWFRVDRDSR